MRPGQKCTRNVPAKSNKKVLKERFLKWVKFSGSLGKLWLEQRYQIGVRERSACRIFWVQHPAPNRKKYTKGFPHIYMKLAGPFQCIQSECLKRLAQIKSWKATLVLWSFLLWAARTIAAPISIPSSVKWPTASIHCQYILSPHRDVWCSLDYCRNFMAGQKHQKSKITISGICFN